MEIKLFCEFLRVAAVAYIVRQHRPIHVAQACTLFWHKADQPETGGVYHVFECMAVKDI